MGGPQGGHRALLHPHSARGADARAVSCGIEIHNVETVGKLIKIASTGTLEALCREEGKCSVTQPTASGSELRQCRFLRQETVSRFGRKLGKGLLRGRERGVGELGRSETLISLGR